MTYAIPCGLVILITLAGCATQPGKDHGAADVNAAGTDTQCHSQQLTGSMISKTVCSTKEWRNKQQALVGEVQDTAMKAVDARPGK